MSFADLVGKTEAVKLLQRSLERGRLGHAYLVTGGEIQDLEAIARNLAKTLNCLQPVLAKGGGLPVDCCDVCLNCRRIEGSNHPDVFWVRPESKSRIITVDQVRELMHLVHLKPAEAKYKFGVLVAADRLKVEGANAFLKTLEEPPQRSILVLLSTTPEGVLETLRSRCLRVSLASEWVPPKDNAQLAWITGFAQLAAKSEKGLLPRYHLLGSLLAQLSSVKSDIDKLITGQSPLERHDDIEPALREKWEDELVAAIEAEYRYQRLQLLKVLEFWLRDVWLQGLKAARELLSFPELIEHSRAVAKRISSDDATENLSVISRTQRLLGSNVQEALALEIGLLKLKL